MESPTFYSIVRDFVPAPRDGWRRVAQRLCEKKSRLERRKKREEARNLAFSFHVVFLCHAILLFPSRFFATFHSFFLDLCHPVSSTVYTFIRPTLFSSYQLLLLLLLLSPSLFSFSDCRDDGARRDKGVGTCTKENDAGRYNGEFPTPSRVCTRLTQRVLLRWITFSWMNDRHGQSFLHFPDKRKTSTIPFSIINTLQAVSRLSNI